MYTYARFEKPLSIQSPDDKLPENVLKLLLYVLNLFLHVFRSSKLQHVDMCLTTLT